MAIAHPEPMAQVSWKQIQQQQQNEPGKNKEKEQPKGDKTEVPPWDDQQWNYSGASTSLRSTSRIKSPEQKKSTS